MVNADAPWIYKIYYMKYPDNNIQIKYPNKLINADTPIVGLHLFTVYRVINLDWEKVLSFCS